MSPPRIEQCNPCRTRLAGVSFYRAVEKSGSSLVPYARGRRFDSCRRNQFFPAVNRPPDGLDQQRLQRAGRFNMKAAPKPCSQPGCGVLVRDGSSRCPKHPREVWTKKVTATKRITGRKLQTMRSALFASAPLCAECERQGRVRLAAQRDHIIPLEEGGTDDDGNVQGLCYECHEAKSKEESQRGRTRAAA